MNKLDQILAEAQRRRETSYREKALKMYPHICGRCGREFSGKRLSELTVHHRDHNCHIIRFFQKILRIHNQYKPCSL